MIMLFGVAIVAILVLFVLPIAALAWLAKREIEKPDSFW